jgi:hypothetical protein
MRREGRASEVAEGVIRLVDAMVEEMVVSEKVVFSYLSGIQLFGELTWQSRLALKMDASIGEIFKTLDPIPLDK